MTTEKLFIATSRAYYHNTAMPGDPAIIEVFNVVIRDDDTMLQEFMIEVHKFDDSEVAPRLQMFEDSWQLFNQMPEFFTGLANLSKLAQDMHTEISVEQVTEYLRTAGFEDVTPVKRPNYD